MKDIPQALQDHLASGVTTMAFCWLVERQDNIVQAFTEHDRDLEFLGHTFLASSGFSATRMAQGLGLQVDNLTVESVLSSDTINEDDLAASKYDDAAVTLFWVNWKDVSQRVIVSRGSIGEVKREQTMFSAEFRSLSHRLNQKQGRSFMRTCDAIVGDARCGIDIRLPQYLGSGTVASAAGRNLVLNGIDGFDNSWFTHGEFKFTSGANSGLTFEVKQHADGQVILWQEPPFAPQVGDNFEVTVGCERSMTVCDEKFDNSVNHRGFHLIPGQDILADYATGTDNPDFDGGSLFR